MKQNEKVNKFPVSWNCMKLNGEVIQTGVRCADPADTSTLLHRTARNSFN